MDYPLLKQTELAMAVMAAFARTIGLAMIGSLFARWRFDMGRGTKDAEPIGFGRDMYSGKMSSRRHEADLEKISQRLVLTRASHWAEIYNRPCRVTNFTPFAKIENGKIIAADKTTPYALVKMMCAGCPSEITGAIGHKLDFKHLWQAFAERGEFGDVEVIVFWAKKPQNWFSKMAALFRPGLGIMLCKAGAFDLISDPQSRPDLTGQARFRAEAPIMQWHPESTGFREGPFFAEDMERLWADRYAQSKSVDRENAAMQRAYEASKTEYLPVYMKDMLGRLL